MESTERELVSSQNEATIMYRFFLVFIIVVFFVLSIIEMGVALNMGFVTQALVHIAMPIGTTFWGLLAGCGWVDYFVKKRWEAIYPQLFLTSIAVGSVAGIFVPTLTTFAIWANALLTLVAFVVIVWASLKTWREFEPTPAQKKS